MVSFDSVPKNETSQVSSTLIALDLDAESKSDHSESYILKVQALDRFPSFDLKFDPEGQVPIVST